MGKANKKKRSYSNDDSPVTYILHDDENPSLFFGSPIVDLDDPKWDCNSIEEIIFGNDFNEHHKRFAEKFSDACEFELFADEESGPEYKVSDEDENYSIFDSPRIIMLNSEGGIRINDFTTKDDDANNANLAYNKT